MENNYRLLIINPGSTSTKVAIYENENLIDGKSLQHSTEEISKFTNIWDQYDFRKDAVINEVNKMGYKLEDFDSIVCRGGNVKPIPGGIYLINPVMLEDMKSGLYGTHPTNVGNLIAYDLGQEIGIPVLTLDPPVTDEYCQYARYSGLSEFKRQSSFHALNQKATARKVAQQMGTVYEDINIIVVHMGGGISVGAHKNGKVIDVNNALDGDGPFSPERAGALPTADLVKLCFSGKYTREEVLKMLTGKGGLMSYLNTNSGLEVEKMIANGDEKAKETYMAMAYQVSKEIGSAAAVLKGKVDAIAFTGSLAYSEMLMTAIQESISFIAPIYVNPGENEMEALALGALRYLRGDEASKEYY